MPSTIRDSRTFSSSLSGFIRSGGEICLDWKENVELTITDTNVLSVRMVVEGFRGLCHLRLSSPQQRFIA